MLENPKHGWCDIALLGYSTADASYLEDYPFLFTEALVNWPEPTRFRIDHESNGWLTFSFGREWFEVFNFDGEDEDENPVFRAPLNTRAINNMRKELAEDLELNFDEWTAWAYASTPHERVSRRTELEHMIASLKDFHNVQQ